MKRTLAALIALGLGLTIAASTTSSAQARDTTWGCPGCIVAHR